MPQSIPPALAAILLLTLSNVFMTFAWYAHLKNLSGLCMVAAAWFMFRGSGATA